MIRLDLSNPGLWETAMTTTSIRALSLQGRLTLPGFTDTLFVIAGDIIKHVLFTPNTRHKRCSFVFFHIGHG